ncbi:hypothetical protein [Nitratifractor salsuginis]|uniref:Uncharacterized protein n=1 Tax=Nitratifractor salsuginis (strain DSM 16511 / JCM 12458 / E9I37-1) TaxID=749222 RepID=E6WYD0_NITSE|nr:hypothetical protein [Nitratifractor salsuginis]ADV46442.1 hypothetical protein Nitsa_1189 [Nitratifractor salsuginis DSM 16511]
MKRFLKVAAVGLIFGAGWANAGNMAPPEIEKYRFSDFPYKGAEWVDKDQNIKDSNKVPMQKAESMVIYQGLYKNDLYKMTGGGEPKRKIVIRQKIPCYVVPKNWAIAAKGPFKGNRKFGRRTEKIDSHTVAVYKEGNGGLQNTTLTGQHRRGLIDMKLSGGTLTDITPKKLNKSNSTIILGDNLSCLNKPNEETWNVYWKLNGKWVHMAREKFYLNQ